MTPPCWSGWFLDQANSVEFAGESLKPTALAAIARKLEAWFTAKRGPERARAALGELSMGVRPDPEADLPGPPRFDGRPAGSRDAFLERFGHRGPQDMELAQPRWREDPPPGPPVAQAGSGQSTSDADPGEWKGSPPRRNCPEAAAASGAEVNSCCKPISACARRQALFDAWLRPYPPVLVELDQRFGLEGGIFYLTPEELPPLPRRGPVRADRPAAPPAELALSLDVPPVLFSDDLEAIGRPLDVDGAEMCKAAAVGRRRRGAALVLDEPCTKMPGEPYILVCPSTDPAWVPLFVQARTGDGDRRRAVARGDRGPRVWPAGGGGLAGRAAAARTGQRLRVDGGSGTVSVIS